jgi:hypothetical protein
MARTPETHFFSGRNFRIRLIHQFIVEKKGNQTQMLKYVNDRHEALGINDISMTTLQEDLYALKRGDFLTDAQKTKYTADVNGIRFDARYDKTKGIESYRYFGTIPPLDFLNEEEQMTYPFLRDMLREYEKMPAFQKFFNEIKGVFEVEYKEDQVLRTLSVKEPGYKFLSHKNNMLANVMKLLKHIHNQEVVQFEYLKPKNLEYKKGISGTTKTHVIQPLCIQLYQNIFYLTGVYKDSKPEKPYNLRIDYIVPNSIQTIPLTSGEDGVEKFTLKDLSQRIHLEEIINRSVGIWLQAADSFKEVVVIRFHDWAAKHLITFQVHSSQIHLSTNEEKKYADFEFTFYTYPGHLENIAIQEEEYRQRIQQGENPSNLPYIGWMNRYPEVGYLLGRYINFIELIEIR